MKIRKRTLYTIGVAVAVIVLAVLLLLIAEGVLILPGTAGPAPVSVNAVQYTILQGTNASGNGWFGPNQVTYSGAVNGFPYKENPGATFSVSIELRNFDSQEHTLYSVSVSAPFVFSSTTPGLPAEIPAGTDDALLQIYVTAPSSPGTTLTLFVTLNALPPNA